MIFDNSKSNDVVARGNTVLNKQTLGYTKKNLYDNVKNFHGGNYVSGEKTVSFTKGSDDTFNVNGTSVDFINNVQYAFSLPVGRYIISKKIASTGLKIALYNQTKKTFIVQSASTSGVMFRITDENDVLDVRLQIPNGTTVNITGQAIMIRPAEITDPTYEPYVDDVDTRLKETVQVERGGTGGTTAKAGQYNLLKDMNEIQQSVIDTTPFVCVYNENPSIETGVVYKRTALTLLEYIKTKLSAIFAPKTQLGGCYLKYEDGKFYIGYDDGTGETEV